jgi:hypothetical protein
MRSLYMKLGIGCIALSLSVFGLIMFKHIQTKNKLTDAVEITTADRSYKRTRKFTLSEYQNKKDQIREDYPALQIWESPIIDKLDDAQIVAQLNTQIADAWKILEQHGEKPKSKEEVLVRIQELFQKWENPKNVEALMRRVSENRKLIRETLRRWDKGDSAYALKIESMRKELKVIRDWYLNQLTTLDLPPPHKGIVPESLPSQSDIEKQGIPIPVERKKQIGAPADTLGPDVFLVESWQTNVISQVLTWNTDLDEQYLDVMILPYLTREEYAAFFPTEVSRRNLQQRQAQMQTDVVNRVQNLLSTDASGNRQEKLSVVREVLSQNWDADFAEAVISQLQQEK